MVCDAGVGGVTLEGQDITLEQRRELSIFLDHSVGGQPGDSISGSVLVFKSMLELVKEVVLGAEGYSGASDGILLEGVSTSQGRSFSHIQESKSDLLCIGVV